MIFDKDQANSNTGVQAARATLEKAQAAYEESAATTERLLSEYNVVRDRIWPDLANAMGMHSFPFSDGVTIDIKQEIYSSVKKDAAVQSQAFDWLEKNGLGGIIKRTVIVELDKGDDARTRQVLALLRPLGVHVTVKESVHPQTLAATIRGLLEEGKDVPFDLLGVGVRSRAHVKVRRKV